VKFDPEREKPAGTVRITAGEHPAISVLQPALKRFLPEYPDIQVEIIIDYGLTDIVSEGYDAGVRMGEQIAKDMIAVRIGPDMRMAVVGSPAYFEQYSLPQTPQDLAAHKCINIRLPTYGGLFPWGLEKDHREVKVRGEGQLVFNSLGMRLSSALDGLGVAYLPEDQALQYVAEGRLIRVLEDWCPKFPGYHLYYPSRRHSSPALTLLIENLRYRGD
jgi:DNA-binding transcriptional LysR family regulator